MSVAAVLAKLRAASERGDVVRIHRKLKRAERLDGFVVGVGKRWVLLHLVDDVVLDGYAAVRVKDLDKVRVYAAAGSFTHRALAFNSQQPQPLDGIDLSSTTSVINGLQQHFPLVCVYAGREDCCYIGRVEKQTAKTMSLHEIDTHANWIDKRTRWPHRDIIRLDVGDRYVTALDALAADRTWRDT